MSPVATSFNGEPVERRFEVNGYMLAGREWNAGAVQRVIALHGWLDNAASFDVLAPILTDCHVLALDLAGHGLSDHKGRQATYHVWDELVDVLAVADVMGWQQIHLLGHSRGAMMSLLLGAAAPERVRSLVLLDAVWPPPVRLEDTASQLARFLRDAKATAKKTPPRYATVEEAAQARSKAINMRFESALRIAERGTEWRDGLCGWRSDPRLTMASAFKLTQAHNDALVDALKIPCLALLAKQGIATDAEYLRAVREKSAIKCLVLEGSHHFHMEEQAGEIAELVQAKFTTVANA